jgi:hypothetical protein
MRNNYCQDVDGFGERKDMALANDKQQEVIRANYAAQLDSSDKCIESEAWGTRDSKASLLSAIVANMIHEGKSHGLFHKSEIHPDMDIHQATEEACILYGLATEDFCPELEVCGFEVEISL